MTDADRDVDDRQMTHAVGGGCCDAHPLEDGSRDDSPLLVLRPLRREEALVVDYTGGRGAGSLREGQAADFAMLVAQMVACPDSRHRAEYGEELRNRWERAQELLRCLTSKVDEIDSDVVGYPCIDDEAYTFLYALADALQVRDG